MFIWCWLLEKLKSYWIFLHFVFCSLSENHWVSPLQDPWPHVLLHPWLLYGGRVLCRDPYAGARAPCLCVSGSGQARAEIWPGNHHRHPEALQLWLGRHHQDSCGPGLNLFLVRFSVNIFNNIWIYIHLYLMDTKVFCGQHCFEIKFVLYIF